MQFIKTAFWVIVAVAIALFSKANWVLAPTWSGYVPVKLWGDIVLETRLPLLIIVAFLTGLLPMWLFALATRWRLRRRLESAERALSSVASSPNTPPPAATPAASVAEAADETTALPSNADSTSPSQP